MKNKQIQSSIYEKRKHKDILFKAKKKKKKNKTKRKQREISMMTDEGFNHASSEALTILKAFPLL